MMLLLFFWEEEVADSATWNHEIWSNFNTFEIILGASWGRQIFFFWREMQGIFFPLLFAPTQPTLHKPANLVQSLNILASDAW